MELKLIKDLGQVKYGNQNRTRHMAIFECPICKEPNIKTSYNQRFKTRNCRSCKTMQKKHGLSNSRIYTIWVDMKQRCLNNKEHNFHRYGGRGIIICTDWINSFESFNEWALNNGYADKLEIDRIDNDGNYEPSNCRWATRKVQMRNIGKNRRNTSGYIGVSLRRDTNKWSAYININNRKKSLGSYSCKIEAAKERDKYIIDNNLEHTKNFS